MSLHGYEQSYKGKKRGGKTAAVLIVLALIAVALVVATSEFLVFTPDGVQLDLTPITGERKSKEEETVSKDPTYVETKGEPPDFNPRAVPEVSVEINDLPPETEEEQTTGETNG
ncbi:MAG: hypothetical protein GX633_04730 [Clostridiales bacterium]|jgi:hypothetical protein|nr:hypothetical protein [Clostridiales bacterium]